MIELSVLVFILIGVFGYIGFFRGLIKETIATSGIVLALFAVHQFDNLIRGTLLAGLPRSQVFYVQTIMFLIIIFFAYHNRAIGRASGGGRRGRDDLQSSVLGAIIGGINGYLIGGTIWYFLDINRTVQNAYALSPYVIEPLPNTMSASISQNLPLYLLAEGPGSNGDLLSLALIGCFLIVLILI